MKLFFIFQMFDFLMYFWHKNPKQAHMPKVPKKVKILKNKNNFIIFKFILNYFLPYNCL